MRIVIDLQGAQNESRYRGIGRYSLSIAKAIAKNRGEHEIIIALSSLFPDTVEDIKNEFKDILPKECVKIWNGVGPTKECENEYKREISEIIREAFLANLKPDIILLTSLFEGFVDDAVTSIKKFDITTKVAVTSHDLIPLIQKDIYLNHNKTFAKQYFQKIEYLKKADLFLGVSQSSCNELIEHLKINSKKIINTSEAVHEGFKSQLLNDKEKEKLYKKYNITKKSILYAPGGFDIRKNFENLIKAYSQLSKVIRATYQLVIVSKIDDGDRARLLKLAKQEGIDKNDFILTGYVSDNELIAFYSVCNLFVYVSNHEGFGLPVLEAMNCGAVVIGANTTSVPEVIGCEDALFDPYSVESIRDKIEEVLNDKEFQKRLLEHNKEQIQKFSWDKSAKITINALERSFNVSNFKTSFSTQDIINEISKYIPETYTEYELFNIATSIKNNQDQFIKKQLFLDISELVQIDARSGIQRVVRGVMLELFKNPPKEYGVKLVYATMDDDYKYATNFTYRFLGHEVDFVEEQYVEYKSGDIFFLLDMQPHVQITKYEFYKQLKIHGVKVYFLLHDLLPLTMTNYFQKGNEERFEKWLHVLSSSTDGAICVSNGTKNIYKQWYADNISTDLNKFKILVSHNGADIDSSNPSRGLAKNTTQVLDKIKKKVSFISVGTLEPRKGHVQTLKAFEKLWNEGFEISLVFVGKIGWNVDNLVESLRNHSELNKRLFWLEGISDEYLQKVYEVSDCLIASSEGEGFGLPLIEAAQKKLPIIARDIPIFREVAGEFAYYFLNDNNPDILAQSIKKWLELYQAKTHPKSDEMPWLTWEDSTKQLLQCLGIK